MRADGGGASGLLVAGTSSDAGKSLVVTGLCRALARAGIKVAPFKAQNMSNNSGVCLDGAEIGRAQFLQAQAAGVEPESAMNPVLLKPGSDRVSHIVLRGRPYGTLQAGEYATGRGALAEAAFAAYAELAARFDLVVCEGAGSPAEINLRAGDYVNLGSGPALRAADDRGRRHRPRRGVRGALRDLRAAGRRRPGLDHQLRDQQVPGRPVGARAGADRADPADGGALRRGVALAGRRVAGRRGHAPAGVAALERGLRQPAGGRGPAAPGLQRHRCRRPGGRARGGRGGHHRPGDRGRCRCGRAARVPGHGERSGLAAGPRARRGRSSNGPGGVLPVLGICGGYQMLGATISDDVEAGVRPAGRARSAAGADHLRGGEGARTAVRFLARAPGHRVRDPPRGGRGSRRTSSRSWTAAGSVRSGAPCGTAPSRTTRSAGPG